MAVLGLYMLGLATLGYSSISCFGCETCLASTIQPGIEASLANTLEQEQQQLT